MTNSKIVTKLFLSDEKSRGHANEKERLLMEMEAVKQECASLESQSVSLKQQITSLTSEVDGT
ncbi:hypothetical protein CsSME_00049157 [Camellia sinensis var. sinensis]